MPRAEEKRHYNRSGEVRTQDQQDEISAEAMTKHDKTSLEKTGHGGTMLRERAPKGNSSQREGRTVERTEFGPILKVPKYKSKKLVVTSILCSS